MTRQIPNSNKSGKRLDCENPQQSARHHRLGIFLLQLWIGRFLGKQFAVNIENILTFVSEAAGSRHLRGAALWKEAVKRPHCCDHSSSDTNVSQGWKVEIINYPVRSPQSQYKEEGDFKTILWKFPEFWKISQMD